MSPSSLSSNGGNGEKPPRPIVVVAGSLRPQLLASLYDEVIVLEAGNVTELRIDAVLISEPAVPAVATSAMLGTPVIRLCGDSSEVQSGEIALPTDVDPLLFRRAVLDAIRIGALERELVESREECERNAARFAAAMSAARSGTWRRDIRTAVVEWSPELHEIFGLAYGTFGGTEQAFYELVHPDDRAAVSEAIGEALAKMSDYEVEFRYLHSSGEYRWMAGRGRGFFDTDGDLIELAGVGIDITDRKRAEGDLRDREFILRQIGDNFPDGALYQVLATPDGERKFVYIGSAMERLTGVPVEEGLRDANSLYSLIHPDDLSIVVAAERRSLEQGSIYNAEVRMRHRGTGEWRWASMRSSPRELPDGSRVWNGIYTDVTERKDVEEALARTVARLDLAQRAGHVGVFDWEIPSGALVWSDEEERLFGIEPGTFEGRIEAWARRVHSEDRERIQSEIQGAMDSGVSEMSFEFRILHGSSGAIRWIEGGGRFYYDAKGSPLRMVGVNYDVTERREAQRELRQVNRELQRRVAELEAVAHVLPVGIAIAHDPHCTIVSANPAFERVLGLSPGANASVTGPTAHTLEYTFYMDGSEVPGPELPLQKAARTGASIPAQELETRFVDGRVLYLLVNAAPILGEDGAPRGAVAAAVDISEAKRTQRALVDADRRKNEFLAMLSHELRNPLAAIRNALHVLESDSGDAGDLGWARGVIDRQSGQLTRLVDDLLDVARITRGKIQLRKSRVDAVAVLDSAAESVKLLIEERGHELLKIYPRDGSLVLDADPSRLEQIVVNLLTNAAKYTPPGGEISLEAAIADGRLVVTVRDTGIGILPEKLPDMFELFTQGDRSLDRSEGGLGLGLTIVRRLAELHGGTATAFSDGPGHGTTFTVEIPIGAIQPAAGLRSPSGLIDAPPAAQRVLVIDDNIDTAHGLARLLSRRGFVVQVAYDGFTGVQYAHTFEPHIMLVDLGLPGMTGYEVAEQIRASEAQRGIFLVAVSGYGQEEDRARTRKVGFDHHLVKPVAFDVIVELLRERSRPAGT